MKVYLSLTNTYAAKSYFLVKAKCYNKVKERKNNKSFKKKGKKKNTKKGCGGYHITITY